MSKGSNSKKLRIWIPVRREPLSDSEGMWYVYLGYLTTGGLCSSMMLEGGGLGYFLSRA